MVNVDEDALLCDMAETYGVFDYKQLPLKTAAALAFGLKDDSRIKLKLSGMKAKPETILIATAVDRLGLLLWAQTKDAIKGRNKPASVAQSLLPGTNAPVQGFHSGKEFEKERKRLMRGEIDGN